MMKSKFKFPGLMLLGLSAAISIMISQQQATILNATEGKYANNKPQFQILETLQKPESLPLGQPSIEPNSNSEEIDTESLASEQHLVISLNKRRVYVYQDKKLQHSYPVAVGKAGWETPQGNYKVIDMQPEPVWEHPWTGEIILPGPNNPLGARWIGFWTDGVNLIGFHGTPNEKLVGRAVSHGCIRMRNQDILALYAQVNIGTPVTVVP
ncbi:MAG: L,D-transpeptidase [Symploca sp. SIO3C6]|uniref:L,D-transpeptidase n=1 Tax=Symploca sp. SIO1C4 TaxID=2607765 RepID=A0A6B3N9J1_9CYAN|nr:L,D-transpeptidase [Symploca sp. SIO3C6]NER29759.1 L,D-transpeptidase [Symploca sp. SIO1C4]NET05294.1 L,D-transpeptidase [Symploca sp. SIO2B6]NET51179.1 L,D-transpeptidase [Merismopedia sp. SIO2A8]